MPFPFPYADVSDVEERWGAFPAGEQQTAAVLITDAADMIVSRWPDIDARLESGELRDHTLKRIIAGMVRRALMNRGNDGVTQQTASAGPFAQTATFSNPDGNLYLTAQDVLDLSGQVPKARMGWLV